MQDAISVFEFKVDGTPEEALKQINSKGKINKKLNNSSHETQTIATITIRVHRSDDRVGTKFCDSLVYH